MAKGTPRRAHDTRSTRGRSVDGLPVQPSTPSPAPPDPVSTDQVQDRVLALLGFDKVADPTHIVLLALSAGGNTTLADFAYAR
jgi:hypothetical protein